MLICFVQKGTKKVKKILLKKIILFKVNLIILENDYDAMYVEFLKCLYIFIKDLNYKNDIIKLVLINGKEVLKKYFTDLYFYNNPT